MFHFCRRPFFWSSLNLFTRKKLWSRFIPPNVENRVKLQIIPHNAQQRSAPLFKWTSFYNFLKFHKILNSYAIYRCKKMVKILNCYLYAKKSYGTLSKGVIFFWPTLCLLIKSMFGIFTLAIKFHCLFLGIF